VLADLGADVGRRFGFDQALQRVLQDGAQHIDVGGSQVVEQVVRWHPVGGHSRSSWGVVRDLHENPAVAFLVYSPPDEPATSPLHHATGHDSKGSPVAAGRAAQTVLESSSWQVVLARSSTASQTRSRRLKSPLMVRGPQLGGNHAAA
jgi:hypothetical protein